MARTPGTQMVVGVDGSAASITAVRWAVREARLHRAADLVRAVLPGTSRPPVQPGQPPLAISPVPASPG